MAKGVKRIILAKGLYYPDKSQSKTTQVTIAADKNVIFEVDEWIKGTPEEVKMQKVYWLRQTNDRKIIMFRDLGKQLQFQINKKFSGSYAYYIEASLSGKRDFKNDAGIYVNGYTEPLIKASDWRKTPTGADIKNGTPIRYGELLYIWLDTEGLNGNRITIEVYNQALGADHYIDRYTNVLIRDGEVAFQIANTSKWISKVGWKEGVEEFYIKAKINNTYIKDHLGDDNHAVYLGVENKEIKQEAGVSENLTPTKVFQAEINAKRHEPCKFDEITVTTPIVKDGKTQTETTTVFKDGQTLQNSKATDEKINRTVHFKFNDYSIAPDAQTILNNILGFLLEHKGTTMQMSGYACVIGPEVYNQNLSQKRSDAVKKFFTGGGLDSRRINSIGRGEYNIQSPDDYDHRNEKVYQDARRVDISFNFPGHTANAVVFETIAPSSPKNVILDILGFEVDDCYRDTEKHKKEVIVKSPDAKEFKGSGTQLEFPIQSTLSNFNPAPLNYIWPKNNVLHKFADSAALYKVHIHSCRYYSLKNKPALLIKAYPDIKWEIAFELKLDVKNYSHTNMPSEYRIFEKHQKIAREEGYKRWLMNKQGKVPMVIGLGLKAEWNDSKRKANLTKEWEPKTKILTKTLSKSVELVQEGINICRGVMKATSLPLTFDIRYPKIEVIASWYLQNEPDHDNKVAMVGELNFGAKPFIGASVTIDLIAAAITVASYATTGSPAISKIIERIRSAGKKVGAEIGINAEFYGELELMFKEFKFNSLKESEMGHMLIGGKMGMKVIAEIKAGNNPWYTKKKPKFEFSALARATGDAYFGGDIKIDNDKNGLYYEPTLKFSGLEVILEAEVTVGWFSNSVEKKYTDIVPSKIIQFEKQYINKNDDANK